MMRYSHVICASLTLGCLALVLEAGCKKSPPGKTEETLTAVDVLKKADAAHKALKAVKYTISFEVTSTSRAAPKVDADVMLAGWGTFGLPKRFRVDASFTLGAPVKLTIGCDGEQFYVVDNSQKKVHASTDPKVLGTARDILRAVTIAEFVHPEPFTDEISGAASQELKDSTKIGDEDCYQVAVKYAGGNRSSVWFFSKTSFLARAVQRIQTGMGGEETARQTLSSLAISALPDNAFAMVVPPGYTTTADPAQ